MFFVSHKMFEKLVLAAVILCFAESATTGQNVTLPGVCIEEVPTSSLSTRGGSFVLMGYRHPSISIIRVCCPGYEANVHNTYICDPACEEPCVNGLCVEPNTCACYPDYVKNLQGECISTCPIGCSHGTCDLSSGMCVCNISYVLDRSKKFCVPACEEGYEIDDSGECVEQIEEFSTEIATSKTNESMHAEVEARVDNHTLIIVSSVLATLGVVACAAFIYLRCTRVPLRISSTTEGYNRPLPPIPSSVKDSHIIHNEFDIKPLNNRAKSESFKYNMSIDESSLKQKKTNCTSEEHIYNVLQHD